MTGDAYLNCFANAEDLGTALPIIALTTTDLDGYLANEPPATRRWVDAAGFRAEPGTSLLVPGEGGAPSAALAGIADPADPMALAPLPLQLPPGVYRLSQRGQRIDAARAILGWGLGAYQYDRYKRAPRTPARLALEGAAEISESFAELKATLLVRDLVNTPTEDLGPDQLEAAARRVAQAYGAHARSIVGPELLSENFPTIHAVGRASHRPPRLIELVWGQEHWPSLVVVGKGVCFDTGGLNLKTGDGMRWMKKDMGGAAHALGLAQLIMARALPVRLTLLLPAVENAVAGNAYRPGEVIITRAGISVEVDNTDAEGRLVLCDALAYAAEQRPELIIDFATLTGAARVALGPDLPALYANRDELREQLAAAGRRSYDPVWPMPLWRPYQNYLKSYMADMANTGASRMAGSITAALFLERFVPDAQPWVHFDTYAWNDADRPGKPQGGEAQGLRAVFAFLKQRFGGS